MNGRILTALKVGNFKAFADTQTIPLKPITLIFGPNSAGKSTFIHSLALAHEGQRTGRLDIFRTEIGGSSVDLGGFRQFVHRRQADKRVEWGVEIDCRRLTGRLGELLAPVGTVRVSILVGLEHDDDFRSRQEAIADVYRAYDKDYEVRERARAGAEPVVMSYEIEADNTPLIRMSRRRDGSLRLDRLGHEHPVLSQVIKAIVTSTTTTDDIHPEDVQGIEEAISNLVPELQASIDLLLPAGITATRQEASGIGAASLFPVSRGNRKEDLANAIRMFLPRTLDELVKGLSGTIAAELRAFQYLGPLRSFPPRHLAFAEHEDANWFAGGGYAWDVVRRNDSVREAVNRWLGSEKLKTPYRLVVRSLVALDQLESPISEGLEDVELDIEPDFDGKSPEPSGGFAIIKDVEAEARRLVGTVDRSDVDRVKELVLIDQRTNTVVSHRDVGIGISQVLPVLVMAYASRGRILAMEQPEIHLHPALQAELGDVFIEAALGGRGNTFILETHSEHLILRLLRRIRETTDGELASEATPIRPENVTVIYVRPGKNGSEIVEIQPTPNGDFLTSWPDGFFAERTEELFG